METAIITPEYLLEVARNTIKAVDYCFLITQGESGQANARLVQHFKPETDMKIWVGTSSKSRKVREILDRNQTTITFQDDREYSYVTMLGLASIENDLNLKQKYWQDDFLTYFPEGPTEDSYILITFVPSKIELMNFHRGVTPKPFGKKPAVLVRAQDNWMLER